MIMLQGRVGVLWIDANLRTVRSLPLFYRHPKPGGLVARFRLEYLGQQALAGHVVS
jgi:hypothetical protein